MVLFNMLLWYDTMGGGAIFCISGLRHGNYKATTIFLPYKDFEIEILIVKILFIEVTKH